MLVVGAGAAGLSCSIEAARGGASVLLVEKDTRLGGTLHLSGGHLAAGGTARQAERGIEDSSAAHRADVMRISGAPPAPTSSRSSPSTRRRPWSGSPAGASTSPPETPRIVYGHEPYERPRTVYGVDEGLSILTVLQDELRAGARPRATSRSGPGRS